MLVLRRLELEVHRPRSKQEQLAELFLLLRAHGSEVVEPAARHLHCIGVHLCAVVERHLILGLHGDLPVLRADDPRPAVGQQRHLAALAVGLVRLEKVRERPRLERGGDQITVVVVVVRPAVELPVREEGQLVLPRRDILHEHQATREEVLEVWVLPVDHVVRGTPLAPHLESEAPVLLLGDLILPLLLHLYDVRVCTEVLKELSHPPAVVQSSRMRHHICQLALHHSAVLRLHLACQDAVPLLQLCLLGLAHLHAVVVHLLSPPPHKRLRLGSLLGLPGLLLLAHG
mmetsp:Transcript_18898/g.72826  ORF Transcript_18898/g.72826 Transcript_18898/m.72826 type:complete len:287 (-) Transcript_18898:86-946(-)